MKTNRSRGSLALPVALCTLFIAGFCQWAGAASLCVNPGGTSGCFAKIGDAVAAAAKLDSISVAAGTYKEDVVIGKPLSLVGEDRVSTIIDATGLSNGIYIDGIDNPHLANVLVRGFTVENANFEGVLVTNAQSVTLSSNLIMNNDKALTAGASGPSCPGIPAFETNEGFDCGEGIHLSGVAFSTVANNIVENNSGGILISDDTGFTHDNLITGNVFMNNPLDCGITIAAHPPAAFTGSAVPFGVQANVISQNNSSSNGLGVSGAGAGVGIFSGVPGGRVALNVVVNNRLWNNGLPGVTFHSHGLGDQLFNNKVLANNIAGNGADGKDAATPGPTGINAFGVSPLSGTVISQNMIRNEAFDIVINNPAEVDVHFNNLLGSQTGLDNAGTGKVDASQNWWGCPGGPGASGCALLTGSNVLSTPALSSPFVRKRFVF